MGVDHDAIFELPTVVNTDPWEYGPPNVPVLVSTTDTIRVLLGTLDMEDGDKPDLMIERRRKGWMIAIHPTNGDPCGIVYLFEDGRNFFIRCGRDSIEVLDEGESVRDDIDAIDE